MEPYKLRIKIGPHEFEAEGPKDAVVEQFEAWTAIITSPESLRHPVSPTTPDTTPPGFEGPLSSEVGPFSPADLLKIFNIDDKRKLVTLRHLPIGEDRHREAVLLTLYGFLRCGNTDEVMVTKLKSALEAAGSAPDRIDRVAEPYRQDGLLVKGGSGKGGKYRLTNTGKSRAEELIRRQLEHLG
jgi:hypothetical protein